MTHYDCSGYATRNDIRCADGRTIRKNAFIGNDGATVPLVWNHRHDDIKNVLGHALLENRDDGVFAYCSFNDTAEGQKAKAMVAHGDIRHFSIYANQLRQTPDGSVMHGNIREVSLVLAGANPGAFIQTLDVQHSADPDQPEEFDADIYTDETMDMFHSDDKKDEKPALVKEETVVVATKPEEKPETETKKEEPKVADNEKTVGEVFDEFTEDQKKVVYFMIAQAVEQAQADGEAKHSDYEGDELMHTNVFEQSAQDEFLMHADEFFAHSDDIFDDAKRTGSLKDAVLQHAADYGIENIDYLFPSARVLDNDPALIKRDDSWVTEFMDKVHKSPFSHVKTIAADITEAAARAKGYIKGTEKANEVFTLLRRRTTPTTVYKHQKIDRADILEARDFDVVSFVKKEMRIMLDEEIARAALIGDGREASDTDKIDEQCIRPIWTDADLYTVKATVSVSAAADDNTLAKAIINGIIRSRKNYKGSGNPTLFTTEDILTTMLLAEDGVGRPLYEDVNKLATKLRVAKIVTVEAMEGAYRTVDTVRRDLVGIIVNPADYNFGADKGGEISMFDDFDIDFNQMKYLLETHVSGALTKPYAAIAVEKITTNP